LNWGLDHGRVALFRGEMKRGEALPVLAVDVGLGGQEERQAVPHLSLGSIQHLPSVDRKAGAGCRSHFGLDGVDR